MASPGAAKEVTIKTGVVKRLIKELNYYEKEAEMESAKLNDMKAKGDLDVHDINKQAEILQDSQQMIPECFRRLTKSVDDLKKVLEEYEKELEGTPEYAAAKEQIKAGSEMCLKVDGTQ